MKFNLSNLAIGIVAAVCLLIDFNLKLWEQEERVIEWDVHSYYAYLPSLFIYHDVKLEKSDYSYGDNKYRFWPVFTEDGKKVNKMSMGTAVLYAPFFFTAHAFALVSGYPADGFSEPYKLFLLLSAVFYLIIGFDFLKKILLRYNFSDKIIAITILLIGLGTNLLCYASQSAPMGHVYSFFLFAVFIYCTIKWYENQSLKNTIVIGLLFGLISLLRPTNAVLILFFLLYGISNFKELKQRFFFFLNNWTRLALFSFLAFLVWVPQFIYWKTVTGNFICYSYIDEGFFFKHPRILDGLLSWRKGWLVYTPMMAFALLGIFFLKGELKKWRLSVILFFIANVYVIFSWWCWWYGGTLGQRSLIESYALLAMPFASFIKIISEKKWFYQLLFYSIALFFIWLNIFQTYQFEHHSLHHEGMTREFYFKQFGKYDRINDFDSYADWPDTEKAKRGLNESSRNPEMTSDEMFSGKKEKERASIQLIAANGKFVCSDKMLNEVIANKDKADTWETFLLILFENNEYALQTDNALFLSAELSKQNEITASRKKVAAWETFTMSELGNNLVAFKAANGKYVSIDAKSFQLFAKSDSIGRNEKFEMILK